MAADAELLPAEQAFRYSARALDNRTLEAVFVIADGYYLYRDKFGFAVAPDGAALGAPNCRPARSRPISFSARSKPTGGRWS